MTPGLPTDSPPETASAVARPEPLIRSAPALLLFWAIAVLLQWRAGAYETEFGTYHDEPAHYVTGLMVRDYIAALAPEPPMTYAQDYYLHYPKVAFGHWPPVFYLVQAAWTLPFGASRASILILLALLSALLAASLYRTLGPAFGRAGALAAAVLLLTLPMVQDLARVLMSDLLHALLAFVAAVALGRYLDRPNWRSSAAFGLFAALAILNKGTGVALALLPVLGILLTGRFHVMKRFSFWLAALIVVALAGPWYWLAPNAMHESAVPLGFVVAGPEWSPRFRTDWIPLVGVALFPLALVGLIVRVVVPLFTRRDVSGVWAVAAGLLVSVLGFRAMTPITVDARHALPVVPVVVMFAAAGAGWLLARFRGGAARLRAPVVAVALALLLVGNVRGMPRKDGHGFSRVASDLVGQESLEGSVFLISSDALGEGMFIAEVAMREARPGHVVLRASKVLSTSGWMGEGYTSFFDTPDQLMAYLEELPVGILVIDETDTPAKAHQRLLNEVIRRDPERWERIGAYPAGPEGGDAEEIIVYRLVGHERRTVGPIDLDRPQRMSSAGTE